MGVNASVGGGRKTWVNILWTLAENCRLGMCCCASILQYNYTCATAFTEPTNVDRWVRNNVPGNKVQKIHPKRTDWQIVFFVRNPNRKITPVEPQLTSDVLKNDAFHVKSCCVRKTGERWITEVSLKNYLINCSEHTNYRRNHAHYVVCVSVKFLHYY